MSRCVVDRHREAEASRVMAVLAVPCLLAFVADVWPAAGWVVGLLLGLALVVAVVVRRVRSAREVARRSR